jgi:hypothetical protein
VSEVDGIPPTGLPVTQVTSGEYRIENALIAEHWIGDDSSLRAGSTWAWRRRQSRLSLPCSHERGTSCDVVRAAQHFDGDDA